MVVILILLSLHSCSTFSETKKQIEQSRKETISILRSSWNHFKNRQGFQGDWWSEKFKHPKMIMDDGRPNAFMDSGDQDLDGVADINWSDPKQPFELAAVSESASYAMLRAIWMKDKKTFDKIWRWTKDNLQHSQIQWVYYFKDIKSLENGWKKVDDLGIERDHLFAWRWTPTIAERDRKGVREDGIMYYRWQQPTKGHNPNEPWRDGWDAASDADQDIALALIYADALWGSKPKDIHFDYASNAKQILKDIWKKETYIKNNYRYLAGGPGMQSIEPGYLSPFSYRVFDDFDPDHSWLDLVDSSYRVFNDASIAKLSNITYKTGQVQSENPFKHQRWPRANLMPDWVAINKQGKVVDGVERQEPEFGTDAFRALWRIAVDYEWNKDPRAETYLKPKSPYGPFDFLHFRMNDRRGDWKLTKSYNESKRLASVYEHNGAYNLYETNYEPSIKVKNRIEDANNSRANAAQYGVYLSFFWSSYLADPNQKSASMVQKLVRPLITPELNGFSQRAYVVPPDKLKTESPQNIARQTPLDKRNPRAEIGLPYNETDGWLCEDSAGTYWTLFDHSEWNSQMDYFSNTWAWFGLAQFAGVIKNFYTTKNLKPIVKGLDVYLDRDCDFKALDSISSEAFYILAWGKDRNPKHRDYFYMKIDSTQKGATPIYVKMVETSQSSGKFKGTVFVGLDSSDVDDRIAGSVGKYVGIQVVHQPNYKKRYRIGQIMLNKIIEDFEDGSPFDSNPMAWWTDALKPNSGKPNFTVGKDKGIYIWRDEKWHIRFLGIKPDDVFSGMILTDGLVQSAQSVGVHTADQFQPLKKSINFTYVENKTMSGIDFTIQGKYVIFDIKYNGNYQPDAFMIGSHGDSAFGAPLILKNQGETGTYKLSINKQKAVNSRYSLQIDKTYIGKPYPYLGGVLINQDHMDWTKYDEMSFDLYLEKDVGPIRCDIQDAKGTVAILNEYNPWSELKGPGWYKWRSNTPLGLAVNANLVQPFSIRDRGWWKGWSFDESRNVDRTKEIDLSNIRNVMFCVHGGAEDSSKILIDNLTLDRINYNYGVHPPWSIKKINLYGDDNYLNRLDPRLPIRQEMVYVEIAGIDRSPSTIDKFRLKLETSDQFPGCRPIVIDVVETSERSGIYRGYFKVGIQSDPAHNVVGAAEGQSITIKPLMTTVTSKTLKVGSFKISTVIDRFDDLSAGQYPGSWWVDTLDPASGRPIYPAGFKLGYFIWKEDGVWRIRFSSDQKQHRFSGVLKSDGDISLTNQLKQKGDEISQVSPTEIKFNTVETSAEDGFDFKTSAKYVEFDILIDGMKYPYLVYVGANDWNKAYSLPFTIMNVGKTKSYELNVVDKLSVSPPNSMQIKKNYFSKLFPYVGKWGLSGELMRWNEQDEFSMWVYLREDVGNIRVDIEDVNRQSAAIHEYDPWDPKRGAGWYKWTSAHPSGIALAERKIDFKNLKDRQFWTAYNTHLERNEDVSRRIKLDKILNIEVCVGSGEKRDALINVDDLCLLRPNRHIGGTSPKRVEKVVLFSDPPYKKKITKEIRDQDVYVELVGIDGDRNAQDNVFLEVKTNDKSAIINKITVPLKETGVSTGIYRGVFHIGLDSDEQDDIIAAPWHSQIILSSVTDIPFERTFDVGLINLVHLVDDFKDGKIDDKFPVSWWVAGDTPEARSYKLSTTKVGTQYAMRVNKRVNCDLYPYFGAWGLRGEVANWREMEDFMMTVYLDKDPGEIRVDIQDDKGHMAVLSGYNPWDAAKGAGWYTYNSSTGIGRDYKNGLLDLTQIRKRSFWMGWDPTVQQYGDVTKTFDFSHVQNVQFLVDAEGQTNKSFVVGRVYVTNWNYHLGKSAPRSISRLALYYDPNYSIEIPKKGSIFFKENFAQIIGIDKDPTRVDVFPAAIAISNGRGHYQVKTQFKETDINSGVYRAGFDLNAFFNPSDGTTPTAGNTVQVIVTAKDHSGTYIINSLQPFELKRLKQLQHEKGLNTAGRKLHWPWIIIVVALLSSMTFYLYGKNDEQDEEAA